uniref:Transcriptional regulator, Crp/Fnr family n=1 Tax=Solibacter usitatus (strain Ellin6076) TaxID=234267 RepID=Q023C9_SOLUE
MLENLPYYEEWVLTKLAALSEIALFAALSENELQGLAQRAVEKRFGTDEMLFWEGEACVGIFLIIQGSVKIFRTSPGGREVMLCIETAPASVAELPLFDGGPYPASVRVTEPVVSLFINKSDFQQFCRQNPDVALKVLAVVGRRLRQLVGLVEAMTFGSVTQRLAKMLLDASKEAGPEDFDLPATHQELASRLGTVREVISRNLGRFRAQGLIKIQDRQVEIVNRAGLQQEAESQA